MFIFFFQFTAASQADQTTDVLQKVGILDSVYSNSLKESRHFYVQLPADYVENSNKKYPVVFILDGEILLPTVYNVQSFYSGGFTPEMVLIGISNAHNRTRDLTTSTITEKYGMPFNEESGGAANFSFFLETELIPYIENTYPVTSFRTLIGHSYGGLFTVYTMLNHSHLFANYIAIDPSLDWDGQQVLAEAKEKFSAIEGKGKSLFMSLSGQLHMQDPKVTIHNVMQDTTDFTLFARSNIIFSDFIKENNKNGLAYKWKFYPRDLHGTISFPSIMEGLIANFEWFQMEHTDKFNSPATSRNDLFNIINYRAEKLARYFGYTVPPYPEDLFNALGYMSMDMDQTEKAKMFFEFAIEFYPKSANAFDSMADYYERSKDYENALKFVMKAFEISGDDYHKQRIQKLKEEEED